MASSEGGRSLEETPTWAVAVVCFVLVLISIIAEHIIHLIGKVHVYLRTHSYMSLDVYNQFLDSVAIFTTT